MTKKLLILGDSPTKFTGFARVVRNLLTRFQASNAFDQIHCWSIGYWGMPHEFSGINLWPAGMPLDHRWESVGNLTRFAQLIQDMKPTHVWIVQDMWGVLPLCRALHDFTKLGINTNYYFPVDAPLEAGWTRILACVNNAVAYCEYGKAEAQKALRIPEHPTPVGNMTQVEWDIIQRDRLLTADRLHVIPHGVDDCWRRVTPEERAAARDGLFADLVKPNDFVLLNVAQNQRRKGMTQSLQVLAELKKFAPDYHLHFHAMSENKEEGVDLKMIARQLGLRIGPDVTFGDDVHRNGKPVLTDNAMLQMYGAADLFLTTTLGEGWGLPITEAMGCGLPVAAPKHTSLTEILADGRGLLLPTGAEDTLVGDNNRLRPRVAPWAAAAAIHDARRAGQFSPFGEMAESAYDWAHASERSWDTIAEQWLDLMGL